MFVVVAMILMSECGDVSDVERWRGWLVWVWCRDEIGYSQRREDVCRSICSRGKREPESVGGGDVARNKRR